MWLKPTVFKHSCQVSFESSSWWSKQLFGEKDIHKVDLLEAFCTASWTSIRVMFCFTIDLFSCTYNMYNLLHNPAYIFVTLYHLSPSLLTFLLFSLFSLFSSYFLFGFFSSFIFFPFFSFSSYSHRLPLKTLFSKPGVQQSSPVLHFSPSSGKFMKIRSLCVWKIWTQKQLVSLQLVYYRSFLLYLPFTWLAWPVPGEQPSSFFFLLLPPLGF